MPLAVLIVAASAWLFFGVRYGAEDGNAVIWFFFSLLGAVGLCGALQVIGVWRAERLYEAHPEQRTGRISAAVAA